MTPAAPAIDAHAHVFRRGLRLAAGRRYTPRGEAPLSLFLERLDRAGLSHGVLVQPSFLGTDNSHLVQCLRAAPQRLRGVAVVDPACPEDELRALRESGVAGIRLNLMDRPLPDLGASAWRSLLDAARRLAWHVEVQRDAAGLGLLLPRLLDAGVTVVVDHYGLPDPAAGASDPGFRRLLTFGGSQRVWVKLSAPYRLGPRGERLARELYPPLRDAFGLARLMWGSDWPHTRFEDVQTYDGGRQAFARIVGDEAEVAAMLVSPSGLFRIEAGVRTA